MAAPRNRFMRFIIALLWLLLASMGAGGSAFAHASLIGSHPADGSIVEQAPAAVRLDFNEPVSPIVVSLTDAQGRHHDLTAVVRNGTIEIPLPSDLSRGSHVLSYRVVSGDGHPIGGAVVFSIGAPSGSANSPAALPDASLGGALWLARLMLHAGLFMGVGGAFFLGWVAQGFPVGKTARLLAGILAVGIAAAGLSLGLQGLDALGQPLRALGSSAPWIAGWRTSFGPAAVIASLALVLAWFALSAPGVGQRRALSFLALVGAGLSLAWSGHAGTAEPQWATRPAVFLHAVCVAYWLGALLPLGLTARQAPREALPAVRRFSAGALVAVAVLALTGLLLACIQVETPANLLKTAYGQVLLFKLLLVAVLLGLAALNRLRLTSALATSGSRWFVRSVAAEIVLALAILAVVGLWRFTPPPRALAAAAAMEAPTGAHLHGPKLMAQVTLLPGRAGPTRARIAVASARAEAVNPMEVTLVLSKPDAGIGPIERPARKAGREGWHVDDLVLPLPGTWQVRVEILVNDFEKVDLEGTIALKP